MADIVELVERCYDLLTKPRDIDFKDMTALATANPITTTNADAVSIACEIMGWSKGEARRRNVSMSAQFATPRSTLKWASVKMGKNEYEPVYIEHEPH